MIKSFVTHSREWIMWVFVCVCVVVNVCVNTGEQGTEHSQPYRHDTLSLPLPEMTVTAFVVACPPTHTCTHWLAHIHTWGQKTKKNPKRFRIQFAQAWLWGCKCAKTEVFKICWHIQCLRGLKSYDYMTAVMQVEQLITYSLFWHSPFSICNSTVKYLKLNLC